MKSEIAPRPDRPYTGFDLRLANLAKFLIRHRRGTMVLQVIIFVACILGTASLRLHDDPNAWPPRSDRFVQLNDRITQHFGGGNSVSIEISVDSGTVFTLQNLHTIKDVTDAIYAIHSRMGQQLWTALCSRGFRRLHPDYRADPLVRIPPAEWSAALCRNGDEKGSIEGTLQARWITMGTDNTLATYRDISSNKVPGK